MTYYDEDDDLEYQDEYQDNIEPVELIFETFSEKTISRVLETAGFISGETAQYVGNMERLVFVYGDDNEVYSSAEIQFTERIDSVIMYSDFQKAMNHGTMACRVIAARLEGTEQEAVTACVAFEKIVNKALDGFNIFLFVTDDSVYFGCRIFGKKGKYDCALSNPVKEEYDFEQVLDEFAYSSDTNEFIEYYTQIRAVITSNQNEKPTYDDIIMQRSGLSQSYIDGLNDVGDALGVDFSGEKERYINMFIETPKESFVALLDGVCDSLSFIASKRVNTYEMLFDADEMMRLAEQTEEETDRIASDESQEYEDYDDIVDDEA